MALLYFIPAALYAMYNNLTFINLKLFDPPTYFVLLQLRIAMTGVVFQILFKQALTRTQWLSILLLMFGCIIKQANFDSMNLSVTLSPAIFLVIMYVRRGFSLLPLTCFPQSRVDVCVCGCV